ncbi:xylulose kinase [[Candida] jaroonii]|uniref:Xylulose kinase n=1 Tax=[Candida] jaroonii TaxID=467808 RepID=A0ACA9Y3E5_9ASCO|nr:xylulose kinase [[Candida] jaroonii]
MSYENSKELYLGFDLSTQQLKIIVTDDNLNHLNTYNVEFDSEFKKYGISKGVLTDESTGEILSPVNMWLDSINYVFDAMKKDGFPFEKVRGISGSAQQHGSVFWSNKANDLLGELDSSKDLSSQLDDAFTYKMSPNWQDHSTGKEIKEFEELVGGADNLAKITGSRAHYRFTGLQIRKLATRKNPKLYKETSRISLVSSFVASVLLGNITNIEEADACGMNLYDLNTNSHDDELLALSAGVGKIDKVSEDEKIKGIEELKSKLGDIKPITYKSDGLISSYFKNKYGFKDCKIYSFTGDNLATIISLPLNPNDILVSLGTSTTVLLITKNYNPSSQYHLFKHPTLPDHYMGMICYCNGSLAREKIRDAVNEKYGIEDKSWDKFNEILDKAKFDKKLGIYFPLGEIVPNASAQFKRSILEGNELKDVEQWDVENDVGSIVESQTLSCRLRTGPMISGSNKESTPTENSQHLHQIYDDLHEKFGDLYTDGKPQNFDSLTSRPNNIFYVGGASNNHSIIKKMGSILGANNKNYKVEIPNACALGGAYKASWGYFCEQKSDFVNFNQYLNDKFDFNDLDHFDVDDEWESYFEGAGMLAKMEQELKHD